MRPGVSEPQSYNKYSSFHKKTMETYQHLGDFNIMKEAIQMEKLGGRSPYLWQQRAENMKEYLIKFH